MYGVCCIHLVIYSMVERWEQCSMLYTISYILFTYLLVVGDIYIYTYIYIWVQFVRDIKY